MFPKTYQEFYEKFKEYHQWLDQYDPPQDFEDHDPPWVYYPDTNPDHEWGPVGFQLGSTTIRFVWKCWDAQERVNVSSASWEIPIEDIFCEDPLTRLKQKAEPRVKVKAEALAAEAAKQVAREAEALRARENKERALLEELKAKYEGANKS